MSGGRGSASTSVLSNSCTTRGGQDDGRQKLSGIELKWPVAAAVVVPEDVVAIVAVMVMRCVVCMLRVMCVSVLVRDRDIYMMLSMHVLIAVFFVDSELCQIVELRRVDAFETVAVVKSQAPGLVRAQDMLVIMRVSVIVSVPICCGVMTMAFGVVGVRMFSGAMPRPNLNRHMPVAVRTKDQRAQRKQRRNQHDRSDDASHHRRAAHL